MPRKNEHEEEELSPEYRDIWDLKKLLLAVILLSLIAVGLVNGFRNTAGLIAQTGHVLSAKSQRESINPEDVALPDSEDVSHILQKVKKDLENITADNVSSSQSALSEIIENLQKLQGGDTNAKEAVCSLLCSKD